MKKIVTIILILALILAMSTGCGAADDVKQISICTPYLSSVTTAQMVELLEEQLTAEGYQVSIKDSANDVAQFATDIETSIVSAVDAIIIVSADPSLVSPQITEAYEAGILIFGCDSTYTEEMQINATSDNYEMGTIIAEYLFDELGGEGEIVHLTYRAHPGVVQRTYAMEDLMESYPDITLISEHHVDVPNQITNAKEIVENLLAAYPEVGSIDAILCGWDEPAIGATQALQEAGRDEILVVGVDGNEQAIELINAGTNMVATISQDFEGMANLVSAAVIKALNGEEITPGDVYAPSILVE